MKKFYFSVLISMLAMQGYTENKSIIMYSDINQYVTRVSPNGKWACGALNDGSGSTVAFVWNLESNERTNLGTGTIAYGVSNDGTVVGQFQDKEASPNGAEVPGAGYWKDGAWHHLESIDDTKSTSGGVANCISANGRYIGGATDSADGTYTPIIWEDGKLLKVLNDGWSGAVYAVTDDGSLAGGWTYTELSGSTRLSAYWKSDGTRVLVDNDGIGNPYWSIQNFNSTGDKAVYIKGIYDIKTGETEVVNALHDPYWSFVLYDITDDNSVVGYEQTLEGSQIPIIYTNGQTQNLEDYLIEKGVDFAADGMIGPRQDTEGQYNITGCMGVSKDSKVFAINIVDKDLYIRSAIVKLDVNATNPSPLSVNTSVLAGINAVKVTWKAPLLNSENIKGYNIYRNEEKIEDLVSDKFFYDKGTTPGTTYTYTVEAEYNDGAVSEKSEPSVITVEETKVQAPTSPSARMFGLDGVMLTWNKPASNMPSKNYFGNDTKFDCFGGGNNSFESAIRFDKEEMNLYKGYKIESVSFYPAQEISSWIINIYKDKEKIYTQNITGELAYGQMNNIKLTNPVTIPDDGDLYIAVQANVPGTFNDYNVIGMLYEKTTPGYSDLVRMVTEDEFYSLDEASRKSQGTGFPLSWAISATLKADNMPDDIDSIKQYNIYRDNTKIGSSEKTSFINEDVENGDYTYAIEAEYADGEKSDKASVNFTASLNESAYKAIDNVKVTQQENSNDVKFEWEAPTDNDETKIGYCGENAKDGVKGPEENNYGYMAQVKYNSSKLHSYDGYVVNEVRFFPTANAEFTFYILKDGKQITEQYVENYTLNEWNTVKLDHPFVINENSTYDVNLDCFDVEPDLAPIATDGEAPFNGLSNNYSLDNGVTFSSFDGTGNWMIGIIASTNEAKPMDIDGYDIRIDNEKKNDQTLTETTFSYDFSNEQNAEGTHRVNIDVIYKVKGKVEGNAVFFNFTTAGISENVVNEISITKDDASSYIRVEGTDVISMEIYTPNGTKTAGGKVNTLDISNLQQGYYILKVSTAEGNNTIKFSISR